MQLTHITRILRANDFVFLHAGLNGRGEWFVGLADGYEDGDPTNVTFGPDGESELVAEGKTFEEAIDKLNLLSSTVD